MQNMSVLTIHNQNFTIDCSLNGWLFTFPSWFPSGPIYPARRYRKNIFHFLPIEDEWNLIDKSSHDLRYDPLITGGNGRKKVYRHTRKVVMFRIQTSEIYGLLEGGRKPRVNRSQAYTWVNFVTVTLTNRQFRDFRIIPSSSSKIKIHNFTYLRYLILASDTK